MSGEIVLEEAFISVLDNGVRLVFDYYGFHGGALAGMIVSEGVRTLAIKALDVLNQRAVNARAAMTDDERKQWLEVLSGRQDQRWEAFRQARRQVEELMARHNLAPFADAPSGDNPEEPAYSTVRGFLDASLRMQQRKNIELELTDMAAFLMGLPQDVINLNPNPFRRLTIYCAQLQKRLKKGETPLRQEVDALNDTLMRTVNDTLALLDKRIMVEMELRPRLDALFAHSLFCLHLADDPLLKNELEHLNRKIPELLELNPTDMSAIETLESRLAVLAEQTRKDELRRTAVEIAAAELLRHFQDLGYQMLESGDTPITTEKKKTARSRIMRFTLRIPGGEWLRFAIHPNLQLSFQVVRQTGSAGESPGEYAIRQFRRQEERFSADFRHVMDLIRQRGLNFRILLERSAADDNIPAATFSETEKMDEDNEYWRIEEPKRRTL